MTYIRPDRILLNQIRYRGFRGGQRVMKAADTSTFVNRNAPSVRMLVGRSTAPAKPLERKGEVRRRGTIHTQQLAHGGIIEIKQ
jgi:hypothetical protein